FEVSSALASAGPVALYLVLTLCGIVVFPIIWWALAFWMHRRGLVTCFRTSMALSLTPMLGGSMLYFSGEGSWVSAKAALTIFFLIPVINVIAILIALMALLIFEIRRKGMPV